MSSLFAWCCSRKRDKVVPLEIQPLLRVNASVQRLFRTKTYTAQPHDSMVTPSLTLYRSKTYDVQIEREALEEYVFPRS